MPISRLQSTSKLQHGRQSFAQPTHERRRQIQLQVLKSKCSIFVPCPISHLKRSINEILFRTTCTASISVTQMTAINLQAQPENLLLQGLFPPVSHVLLKK